MSPTNGSILADWAMRTVTPPRIPECWPEFTPQQFARLKFWRRAWIEGRRWASEGIGGRKP